MTGPSTVQTTAPMLIITALQNAPSSGSPWRTIMSYEDGCLSAGVNCPRALNWSNPNINIGSDPTGVASGAQQQDNHQTLNNTALTVANFRCASPKWQRCVDEGVPGATAARNRTPTRPASQCGSRLMSGVRTDQDTQLIHQHERQIRSRISRTTST